MSLNLLNLGKRESTRTSRELRVPVRAAPVLYRYRRPWFPARGLICSIIVHGLLYVVSVWVPWDYWLPPESPATRYEVTLIKNNEPLLLPDLKPYEVSLPPLSGGAPEGRSGGGSGKLGAPAGRPFKGVVHRGPQVIVSNPEQADNYVQTIRQPELIRPPKLPFPLPFPNIVAIKPAVPVQAAPSVEGLRSARAGAALHKLAATADVLAVPPPVEVTLQNAKIVLPDVSPVPPAPGKEPEAEHASVPLPPPLPSFPVRNNDSNLLVLTAIPAGAPARGIVPPGELHGAFAVSPTAPPSSPSGLSGMALGGSKDGTGTGTGGTSNVAKLGSGAGAGTGKSGTQNGSGGTGKGPAHSGLGTGSGSKGEGTGSGGNGGHGVSLGAGPGNGPGTTTTLAAGSGPGGPFPGISIEGGTAAPVMASGGLSVRTPGTYALTIVGSGASGGGLKDYGVFHNEPVYTIYVDVAGAGGTAWTLQYAVIRVAASAAESQSLVAPPYPVEKHAPDYPGELASLYEGRLIVVQGVIDADGKVQNLKLVQSPHPKLAQALTEALKKCTFGAAEASGKAVAIKFLLGATIMK